MQTKNSGRKRQLLVDTDGRIWFAHVCVANEPDGLAALCLSGDILCQNDRLKKSTAIRPTIGFLHAK